jgi:hypothetical protein
MVQMGLNNAKRQRLGGLAPCQVFLGRDPVNHLSQALQITPQITRVIKPEEHETTFTQTIMDYVEAKNKERLSLIAIVEAEGVKRRAVNDRAHEKHAVQMDISIGDYVLLACTSCRKKLLSQWLGPFVVTEIVTSHIVRIKGLIDGITQKAHIARLHKYSNLLMHTEEDLKEQMAYFGDSLTIEKVVNSRVVHGQCEFEIHWEGFEQSSDSWEPGPYIYEVAEDLVKEYLDTLDSKQRAKLLKMIKPAAT